MMRAGWQHFLVSLRINLRNPMAMGYGFAFPLIFLAAFWILYRHESAPLRNHLGELLTISVLGGACFGLPTALVSERERGVWRRYRLTPVPTWVLLASTTATRYLLILCAALLQLGIARLAGMPAPENLLALWVAFTCATLSFIGLGLVIAQLADTVPAVQALGQCIFLPMLIIGGVAVPLAALPDWAQQFSAFLPGRHAVDAIQGTSTGQSLAELARPLSALLAMGLVSACAAALLFRWDQGQRFLHSRRRGWVALVFAAWIACGFWANPEKTETTGPTADSSIPPSAEVPTTATPTAAELVEAPKPTKPWSDWRELKVAHAWALNYDFLAPDDGVVTPFASPEDEPDDEVVEELAAIKAKLATWAPGLDPDPVRAVSHLLCIPSGADLLQMPNEPFLPPLILAHLQERYPREDLILILTWIARNPGTTPVVLDLTPVGIPQRFDRAQYLRERLQGYATKFVGRLIGRIRVSSDQPVTPP